MHEEFTRCFADNDGRRRPNRPVKAAGERVLPAMRLTIVGKATKAPTKR